MRVLIGLLMVAILAGCANSGTGVVPPRTVDKVDLQRYQGTWYELARLPMFFQRNCVEAQATYVLQPDGRLGVSNGCRTQNGEWQEPDKAGKLRLMYEANPMSFIIEQAGGAATDGQQRILDIQPTSLHQRVPVFLGSKEEVERVSAYHKA